MYNPQNLNECEKEKGRMPRGTIDMVMTGVGLIASVSSIPQVIKIYQTGSIEGISLTTQVVAFLVVVSWFLYGMYIRNKPLSITSGVSALVLGTVIIQMFVYG